MALMLQYFRIVEYGNCRSLWLAVTYTTAE